MRSINRVLKEGHNIKHFGKFTLEKHKKKFLFGIAFNGVTTQQQAAAYTESGFLILPENFIWKTLQVLYLSI